MSYKEVNLGNSKNSPQASNKVNKKYNNDNNEEFAIEITHGEVGDNLNGQRETTISEQGEKPVSQRSAWN